MAVVMNHEGVIDGRLLNDKERAAFRKQAKEAADAMAAFDREYFPNLAVKEK